MSRRRQLRRSGLGPRLVLLLCAWPCLVLGHAVLNGATPAAGAALARPPLELELAFNSLIETAMTRVILVRPGGEQLSLETVPGAAGKVRARLPLLTHGVYHVHWRVLASDGHVTEGKYHFTVLAEETSAP